MITTIVRVDDSDSVTCGGAADQSEIAATALFGGMCEREEYFGLSHLFSGSDINSSHYRQHSVANLSHFIQTYFVYDLIY
jgi:hypothetical protein